MQKNVFFVKNVSRETIVKDEGQEENAKVNKINCTHQKQPYIWPDG